MAGLDIQFLAAHVMWLANSLPGLVLDRVASERVQSLLSKSTKNAKWTNCRLVLSHRSQFFHSLLFLSSQAKLRSTTQRLGITLKV